jgi:transitional endoplasmic reticulum ATPase
MLAVQFADVPLSGVSLDRVAARTNGFLAGDIAVLVSEAVHNAVERHDEAGTLGRAATVGEEDVERALATVSPSGLEEFTVTRPGVSYDDIGGLTEVKRQLVRTIEWPLLYPDLFEQVHRDQPAGVLMYGPPGTGKTMLAKAVATSSDANFIAVSGPELFDRYVGESERAVRRVFERAREAAPTVVFFDEVDALAARRDQSDGTGVTDRVVSQLLTELDGIEPSAGVVPIGATNRPDLVDRALLRPGRFERVLEVPLPDAEARAKIFAVHMEGVPVAGDVDTADLADATEGYSGSDIAAIVREAGLLAMEDSLKASSFDEAAAAEEITVTRGHLRRAIDGVGRSVTDEMRETYASYAADLRQ